MKSLPKNPFTQNSSPQYYKICHKKSTNHKISKMSYLTVPGNPIRKLKINWPRDTLP